MEAESLTSVEPVRAPGQASTVLPARIDRFKVQRSLGAGSQGTVLLATDEKLGRDVALKLLHPSDALQDSEALDIEAQISSQLQHPNLVTLHEVGTYHHLRYLVFEYVNGNSLKDRLNADGALSTRDAVIFMSQILSGVAYLHGNGIVHRDLSPANILFSSDGIPKVTDFGISMWYQEVATENEILGTLPYMSPEPFNGTSLGPYSDVFTLGVMFYEMLSGRRLMECGSREAIVDEIVYGDPVRATSALRCDEIVKGVIKTALCRDIGGRYPSAREMKEELDTYRIPRGNATKEPAVRHSTVDFLVRRMRHKKGFSALSGHITKVLELTSERSRASAQRIANILAKDITLSQRVLTAANSAFYGSTAISTLPRAIVLLGFGQVRMCITKALIEQQFEDGGAVLQDALIRSFYSAILAKVLASRSGFGRIADVFTCAMFHDLVRTLTIHYFPEEHEAIMCYASEYVKDELTSSREILGIPYFELGAEVARVWKFPEPIVNAMQPLPRGKLRRARSESLRLAFIAAYANRLVALGVHPNLQTSDRAFARLLNRGRFAWPLKMEDLGAAFEQANALSVNYAKLLNVDAATQPSLQFLARPFSFQIQKDDSNPAVCG